MHARERETYTAGYRIKAAQFEELRGSELKNGLWDSNTKVEV